MGIDCWVRRGRAEQLPADSTAPGEPVQSTAQEVATDWPLLRAEVAACVRCALHKDRTQTVFGVGNPQADWLVVGEAPGAEEDRTGEPFVGRAGKLLNNMLAAIGLAREQIFIANMLKCRPPRNRDPKQEEVAECREYLQRQIALISPRIILVVGRIAAQQLLQTDRPLAALRGKKWELPGTEIPVVVTYHPAYLLRSPDQKAKSWQDLRDGLRLYNSFSSR